jgi:hypothetical protein
MDRRYKRERNQYDRIYNIIVESERIDEILPALAAVPAVAAKGAALAARGAMAVGRVAAKGAQVVGRGVAATGRVAGKGLKAVGNVAGKTGRIARNKGEQMARERAMQKVQQKVRGQEEEDTI